MKFNQIAEREVECKSDSGSTYHLTAEICPDEWMDDEAPMVWSCDCPAGRHGRDCKHLRFFLGTDEKTHAKKTLLDKVEKKKNLDRLKEKIVESEILATSERREYEKGLENIECKKDSIILQVSYSPENIIQFEEKWGFFPHESRLWNLCENHARTIKQ